MRSDETPSDPVLDLENALARLGGDRELFGEMAGYMIEDAPPLLEQLREAVAANDAFAVRMNAHALKGLIAGCGGVRATNAAQSLEQAGESGNLKQAASQMETLDCELKRLFEAIREHATRPAG
jgi:HPt (histidine-containing phosphotransfer) domain-containing protein